MSPQDLIVTILGLALVIAGRLGWKDWLDSRLKEKEIESRLEMSREETKRLEVMRKAVERQPVLFDAKEDADASRDHLMRALDDPDEFRAADISLVGRNALELARKPRERSTPVRIDGDFKIIGVGAADPAMFRLHLSRIDDGTELHADAKEAVLTHDMRLALQRGEWERKPVHFSINARELRGQIMGAEVVSATLQAVPSPSP